MVLEKRHEPIVRVCMEYLVEAIETKRKFIQQPVGRTASVLLAESDIRLTKISSPLLDQSFSVDEQKKGHMAC